MTDHSLSDALEPHQEPPVLINAIWKVRREGRTDLKEKIVRLLDHASPMVREESLNLLAVKWRDQGVTARCRILLKSDPEFGVRSAAAWALAVLTNESSRSENIALLRSLVLNADEDSLVRQAAYQALRRTVGSAVPQLTTDPDVDAEVDLEWVRNLER